MIDIISFEEIIKKELGIVSFDLNDSVFHIKYNLTETDMLFLIFKLAMNGWVNKEQLKKLLEMDEITFGSLLTICNMGID